MSPATSTVKIPVTIELDEEQLDKILSFVEGEASDAHKVEAYANEVLSAMSTGAALLSSDVIERIRNIDPELTDPDALVEAAERGVGQVDGLMSVPWKVDPALYPEIKNRAEVTGVTPATLVQEMMDQATAMGWFWDLQATTRVLFLSHEQADEICRKLGKETLQSTDIVALVESIAVPAKNAESPNSDAESIELFS
jgi:hypothetical protein